MTENTRRILSFIASFIFFPVGIVLFIVGINSDDAEKKQLGKQCLFVSFLPMFIYVLFLIIALIMNFLILACYGTA